MNRASRLCLFAGLFILLFITGFISTPVLLAQAPPSPDEPGVLSVQRQTLAEQSVWGELQTAASATITEPTPSQLTAALGIQPTDVLSVSLEGTDPVAVGLATVPLGNYFPTEGNSFVILATGRADSAELPNTSGSLSTSLGGINNVKGNDMAQILMRLKVPNAMNCANLDFAFFSEEFPEYVGSSFNDTFTAELGSSTLVISGTEVLAPNNFAFDTGKHVISVNTVFGVSAATSSTYDGETPLLRAQTPVTPGAEINLIFTIQDLGDSVYDSAVFLDKFFWSWDAQCNPGSQVDEDGDGLLNAWETEGLTVTVGGAAVFVDLPTMGANPKKKDIYVELDYMVDQGVCVFGLGCIGGHSHQPSQATINRVVQAFANAPVPNADGTNGIVLHVDAGPGSVMNPVTGAVWGAQSASNNLAHMATLGTSTGNFYEWAAFDALKNANFSLARASVFHYLIFAHNLGGLDGTSGISRDIGASDFVVSLGSWSGKVGTDLEQAGTFMHELGHNLGLRHSGVPDDNDTNFKPNYLSVMNYSFQTNGLIIGGLEGNLDYSRFALPTLDENALDEQLGLNGGPSIAQYGTRYYCGVNNQRLSFTSTAIDWNCDGDALDSSISANINEGHSWRQDTTIGNLPSYNDWQNLVFTGGAIGQPGAQPVLPESTIAQEITHEQDDTILAVYSVALVGIDNALLMEGTSASLNLEIANRGTAADTYTVSAYANVPWIDLTAVPSTISLAPGGVAQFDVAAQPPAGSVGQQGVMTITVVSQANPLIADSTIARFTVSAAPLVSTDISTAAASIVADSVSQTMLTITVVDYYSRPLVGAPVTLSTTLGTVESPVVTNAEGVAIARLTAGTTAGIAKITAHVADASASVNVTLVSGPPATIQLTPEVATLAADGVATGAINFRVRDAFANPVPNATLVFTSSLGTIGATGTTNAAGIGAVQFLSAQAVGVATIGARLGDLFAQTSILLRGEGLAGLVFVDLNRNGTRDLGEAGIKDIEVVATLETLAQTAAAHPGAAAGTSWTVRSNAEGMFAFTELPLGKYQVVVQTNGGRRAVTPTRFVVQVGKSGANAPSVGMLSELMLPYLHK